MLLWANGDAVEQAVRRQNTLAAATRMLAECDSVLPSLSGARCRFDDKCNDEKED